MLTPQNYSVKRLARLKATITTKLGDKFRELQDRLRGEELPPLTALLKSLLKGKMTDESGVEIRQDIDTVQALARCANVLAWYADQNKYEQITPIMDDRGKRAKAALASLKKSHR